MDISLVRNDFDGVNISHYSQKAVVDSLENTQANEVVDNHENVEQYRFERV